MEPDNWLASPELGRVLVNDLDEAMTEIFEFIQSKFAPTDMKNVDVETVLSAVDEHAIISVADIDGRIIYANSKFCKISGYSIDELIGSDHRLLNSRYHDAAFFDILWQTIASGQTWRGKIRNRRKNGDCYWVDSTILPYVDSNDKITGFVSVRTDVTDFVEREELLQAYKKEVLRAAEAECVKSEFLININHEIRTPMNGVSGPLEMLKETSLTEEQTVWVDLAQKSCSHLLEIVENLIDVSQMKRDEISLKNDLFNPVQEIETVISSHNQRAENKNLKLRPLLPDQLPHHVFGDKDRLKRVLHLLLDNAIKFTDQGWIDIIAHPRDVDEHKVSIRFTVQDTGVGLDAEEKHLIFDDFQQADGSDSRAHEGIGLGLSIAKHYIELMGGKLQCDSKKEQGSRFWFEIIFDLDQTETQDVGKLEQKLDYAKGYKILLVEDHATNRILVRRLLEQVGISVDCAVNGFEALEAVRHSLYDLILMDIRMPGMDGFDVTREIRKLGGHFAVLPIIALTASSDPMGREKCLAAGMNDYYEKPIELKTLLLKIHEYLMEKHEDQNALIEIA